MGEEVCHEGCCHEGCDEEGEEGEQREEGHEGASHEEGHEEGQGDGGGMRAEQWGGFQLISAFVDTFCRVGPFFRGGACMAARASLCVYSLVWACFAPSSKGSWVPAALVL